MVADYNTPNRINVREYLLAAYLVDEKTVSDVLLTPAAGAEINKALSIGSYTYYVGDQLAKAYGWEENPDYDPDEDEDEDDDLEDM